MKILKSQKSSFFFKFFTFSLCDYISPLMLTPIFSAPLISFRILQIGSLIPSAIRTENLKTIFHTMIFEDMIQNIRLESFIKDYKQVFTYSILPFLIIPLILFTHFHYRAVITQNYDTANFINKYLFMTWFFTIDTVAMVPLIDLCVKNYYCEFDSKFNFHFPQSQYF